jgi:hypothetical protein
MRSYELHSSGSGWELVAPSREHGDESLGSIKEEKYLEQLSDY